MRQFLLLTNVNLLNIDLTGQDSSVHIASFTSGGASSVQVIRFRDLPLCKLLFLSEVALVGAGHDFNPFLFTSAQGEFR